MIRFYLFSFLAICIGCKLIQRKKEMIIPKEVSCFQMIDSTLYSNPKRNGVTLYHPTLEWFNEYCIGICRHDSIILHSYNNGIHRYDTILNPAFKEKYIKDDMEIKNCVECISIYKNLIDDSLLRIGTKNGSPVYDTIRN